MPVSCAVNGTEALKNTTNVMCFGIRNHRHEKRKKLTKQGKVISGLTANLFLAFIYLMRKRIEKEIEGK